MQYASMAGPKQQLTIMNILKEILMQAAILILFFLDSIREMQKYSSEEQLQKTVWWWLVIEQ